MAANRNQLAAEMARFEQEVLGVPAAAAAAPAPTPLFPQVRPPPPPPGPPPIPPPHLSSLPEATPLFPQHATKFSVPVPAPAPVAVPPVPVPLPVPRSVQLLSAPGVFPASSKITVPPPSVGSGGGGGGGGISSKKKAAASSSLPSETVVLKSAVEKAAEAVAISEVHLKQKKVSIRKGKKDPSKLRLAGGQVWEDKTLEEWDPNDYRIFCGDLGNDVNDDTLAKAFSKYPTFLKAKVVRDKFSKKTKGFGFVSFRDAHDFMQAMREMNGKYVGSRPIRLTKSTWKDRNYLEVKKKDREKKKLGLR